MARILIVDDDELFRDMLHDMVIGEGHEVECATNGQEALNLVGDTAVDLVITDILMPEKDGIELIMELGARPESPPIIAVSGGRRAISREFNLDSARLMGVRATLAKPFTREQLRTAINDALSA